MFAAKLANYKSGNAKARLIKKSDVTQLSHVPMTEAEECKGDSKKIQIMPLDVLQFVERREAPGRAVESAVPPRRLL